MGSDERTGQGVTALETEWRAQGLRALSFHAHRPMQLFKF